MGLKLLILVLVVMNISVFICIFKVGFIVYLKLYLEFGMVWLLICGVLVVF